MSSLSDTAQTVLACRPMDRKTINAFMHSGLLDTEFHFGTYKSLLRDKTKWIEILDPSPKITGEPPLPLPVLGNL